MFLKLQRFIEIINNLESSHKFIASNILSITWDKSGEPQKDILDDDFIFTTLSIFMIFNDFRATFAKNVERFQLGLFCR
jgi:hypothetical protein